jgi:glycosyltransferase involved in cell wall biosynthesis
MGTPRGSGVPRVTTCMDLIRIVLHEQYLPGRLVYRHVLRAAEALRYHSACRVQAISEHTAHDLVHFLGVPSRKIDVVLHGLDHQRFHPYEGAAQLEAQGIWRRYGLTDGAYFVYAGNADPRKNVDVLIDAFARARLGDYELVLLGRQRPNDQRRIDAAIQAHRCAPRVRQLGFVPDADLPALYAGACAFVFCSIYEGFGFPIVEAMACGCPAIHTGLTAMRETVGDAGLVVPARDAQATAQAMTRVAREPGLHAELRRAGIAQARRFDWARTAADTVESYTRALG